MTRHLLRPMLLFAVALGLSSSAIVGADPPNALRYYYPLPASVKPPEIAVDVCVYGATPGGIMAALQARRMGKTAELVEFGRHVGGMTSSGLSRTDGGAHAAGLSKEFYRVVGQRDFKPAAAEKQFRSMLDQAGVGVLVEHQLKSVEKSGGHILAIECENGTRIRAKMFIDSTYEGDLLARAGVSYTVGREANAQYHETLDGVSAPGSHNFRFPVDPYVTPGDPASGLLKGISSDPPGKLGDSDRHVQAYNFRMFLTRAPNRVPFPKPADYDPDRYTLLARYIAAGAGIGDFMQLHEGDSNNEGGFSTDNIGGSDLWPEADYATREAIFQDHVSYQQGLMWFVTHDPRVPEEMRRKIGEYGLSPGDFPETGGWPHQLYVREGRRLVSDYVMTEHNCRSETVGDDSIGLAEYNMDSHNCQRNVIQRTDKETGNARSIVKNEGDVQVHVPGPYPVAYRAIVPRERECNNLLVPVCLSATHIAYGSIRMEPVFMVLGQSAGTAAAMAIDAKIPVQRLDYGALRRRLLADGQMLDAPRRPR